MRLSYPVLWTIALAVSVSALPASAAAQSLASAESNTEESIDDGFTYPDTTDPRYGLEPGMEEFGVASWNLRNLSLTPEPERYDEATNSDLAFKGDIVIQGNYNGILFWDISDPENPVLVKDFYCPSSQNDVSVYGDLLFVSAEGLNGRVDCGDQGVADSVSTERMRGIRIFDISDIQNPVHVTSVQTCRGSHTHSLLVDPDDDENVYVYVSGSAPVRSPNELPGCSGESPEEDPNSALFRLEVIRVPLASPQDATIVSSPRIFEDLEAPETHGPSEADLEELERAREEGAYIMAVNGQERVVPDQFVQQLLQMMVRERGGEGEPTAADSTALRESLDEIAAQMFGGDEPERGPSQCHDITLYPAIGLAGGACVGYGMLLDITDPVQPKRVAAVADQNFAIWHSATFSNDGSKVLFSDEWGGGGGPKCRASDPMEWGADAIFTIEDDHELAFHSYYKLPVAQTSVENCVAHNGSLIPIPGREVMVQGWYQGGISVFDWTDPANPYEIAYYDRGPVDPEEMVSGGSWSVYWYNGVIVNSEIARGLDLYALEPSEHLTENEIEAAKTARFDYLNVQGQQKFEWPPSFVLARAYLDQLERGEGLDAERIADARETLAEAEEAPAPDRRESLEALAAELDEAAADAGDPAKVRTLVQAVRDLAAAEG